VSLGTEVIEEDGEEVEIPFLRCTALAKDGGTSSITVIAPVPSLTAPEEFFFFVPGVDSARLELSVP
jgi:hypothetical protein